MFRYLTIALLAFSALLITGDSANSDSENYYFGVRIAAENDCSDYRSIDFNHVPKLDVFKAEELDGIYAAYEDSCYNEYSDVDIEHLVAKREAHDSGMCDADIQTRINFANDLENVALASPTVNRGKSTKDPADWLPENNQCWYVWQWLNIKRKYNLTIDQAEKNAIASVLQNCSVTDLVLDVDDTCPLPDP
ncbi:MAG: HNH endonuclease [Gammaproteobacteria bacterium]|nr:HNH endonuclease [Gammaproteobacteria bacterium]MYC24483.1 HNH endonuclease [Gammaproteobacteria bacterium]